MSFSDSEGVEVSRGVVVVMILVAMLLLDGWRCSAPFDMFSTGAASNSGKPALET